MTPTEKQIGGNILIAERLGYVYNIDEEKKDLYPNGYWSLNDDEDWCKAEDFEFHSNWNWLAEAYNALGFDDMPTDIEKAWNNLVDILRSQAN